MFDRKSLRALAQILKNLLGMSPFENLKGLRLSSVYPIKILQDPIQGF